MTIEYGSLKFFGWPTETPNGTSVDWTLDEEDERQLEADIDGLDSYINYLENKVKQIDIKKNPTKERRQGTIL